MEWDRHLANVDAALFLTSRLFPVLTHIFLLSCHCSCCCSVIVVIVVVVVVVAVAVTCLRASTRTPCSQKVRRLPDPTGRRTGSTSILTLGSSLVALRSAPVHHQSLHSHSTVVAVLSPPATHIRRFHHASDLVFEATLSAIVLLCASRLDIPPSVEKRDLHWGRQISTQLQSTVPTLSPTRWPPLVTVSTVSSDCTQIWTPGACNKTRSCVT